MPPFSFDQRTKKSRRIEQPQQLFQIKEVGVISYAPWLMCKIQPGFPAHFPQKIPFCCSSLLN
jgi:hypothetical protein